MSRWFVYFLFYSLGGYGLEKLHARLTHSPRPSMTGEFLPSTGRGDGPT